MVTARSNLPTHAELLQYNRVRKLANVRIACTLECDGPRIGRIPGHSFGPPDRGALALALLCFTRRSTVFGADEWKSNVIGYGHGGLLSSLHMVSASSSPWALAPRAPF